MDVTQSAGAVLRNDIGLATSLDLLRGSLPRSTVAAPPTRERLRRELERHPEQFRVLRPDRGPWCARSGASGVERESAPPAVVVPIPRRGASGELPERSGRLRRSLYWVGATVDEHSSRAIARWVRLAHSCASTEVRIK